MVGFSRSLRYTGCLFQQIRRWRSLSLKSKGAITIHRDHHGNFQIRIHLRRLCVESLAELHDVHTMLAQRWTNWRRCICFTCRNLEFYVASNFLCHLLLFPIGNCRLPIHVISNCRFEKTFQKACIDRCHSNLQSAMDNRQCLHSSSANVTFSTSRKFSSTGVERPKIVTVPFKVDLSSFTSSTLPVKLWKGPDLMRTVSPAA